MFLPQAVRSHFVPDGQIESQRPRFDPVGPLVVKLSQKVVAPEATISDAIMPTEAAVADASNKPLVRTETAAPPGFSEADMDAARRNAYAKGVTDGTADANKAVQHEIASLRAVVEQLGDAVDRAEAFSEPLRRLALHIAEQVLRVELENSGRGVAALVENVLLELDRGGFGGIVVTLNPSDLENYQAFVGEVPSGLVFVGDVTLSRGSVVAAIDDRMVSDLIEHRLLAIAESLLGAGKPLARPDADEEWGNSHDCS